MKLKTSSLLPAFIVGALCLGASAPVAIRVEVEPLHASGTGTEVAVIIRVSPEDRVRVGANAMVRIELDGEVPPGQSPLWAVRVKSDGGARVTTVWPPGEHHLKVEIESPSGEETGLWVGTVRIPSFGDDGAVTEPPSTQAADPEPDRAPAAVPALGTAVAAKQTGESVSSQPDVAKTPPMPDDGPVDAPSPAPAADEPKGPKEGKPAPASEPEQPVLETAAVAAAGAVIAVPPPEPEPASGTTTTEEIAWPPIAEPLRSTEAAPVVEPLRAETAPAAVAAKTAPAPLSDDVAAAYEVWADADPGTTDVTVVVSRGREPVPGLVPDALRLRVGKVEVPIAAIGDAGNSPVYLGVAVDLSPAGVSKWPAIGRSLEPLVGRAGGGRGRIFVAADGDETDWDVDPGKISEVLDTPAGGDLATLIVTSLARFEGQRGRTFLILLTDGRFDTSKSVWSDATAAVDGAGVPILVLALWDDKFPQRARKTLQQITAASGGRLFLVQATDQLGRVVERYGRIVDAGVALRFQKPAGMKSPSPISVEAKDRTVEVTAPKMIR